MLSSSANRDLSAATALEQQGKLLEAVDFLQETNRRLNDARIEGELIRLRRAAFGHPSRLTEGPILPSAPVPPLGSQGVPVTTPDQLSPQIVRESISRHGSLLVEGLLDASQTACLRSAIDQALEGFETYLSEGKTSAWFYPFYDLPNGEMKRRFMKATGSVLTADSPRAFYQLVEVFKEIAFDRLVASCFQERPAVSAEKCTLRRIEPTIAETGWHQDGAFLGTDIRSLNLWIALSPCGKDAPTLEIVPRRLDYILPTGTPGAHFDWSVSDQLPEFLMLPKTMMQFEAGDALLFDHFMLHRTGIVPGMSLQRYASENWFFAPASYPVSQTPLCI